jgi:hypothetical protein
VLGCEKQGQAISFLLSLASLDKNIDRDAGSDLVEALGKLINNILGNLSNNGVDNEVSISLSYLHL